MTTRSPLDEPREFTYIKPTRRRPSVYESVSLYQQPHPDVFDIEGWFSAFPDGRPLWTYDSTAARSSDWFAYRDPAARWQRTYVAAQAEQERAIQRMTEAAVSAGALGRIDRQWLETGLVQTYLAFAFYEAGLSRAFAVAQRETLSDPLSGVYIFQAADKLRHAQALVLYGQELRDVVPELDENGPRQAWLADPVLQPARRAVEQAMALTDWVELAVAINLFLDPLAGRLILNGFVGRGASRSGDPVSPMIALSAQHDHTVNRAWTVALLEMLLADASHATHNRDVLAGWVAKWTEVAKTVVDGLASAFERVPAVGREAFDAERAALEEQWRQLLGKLDLA